MGSLTFSEIVTIVVIILIVFGPNRLPEFSRKVGQMLAWGRRNLQEFSNQIGNEFGDQTQPLADLRNEVEGLRSDITEAMNAVTKPLANQSRGPGAQGLDAEDEASDADAESAGQRTTDNREPTPGNGEADDG